MRLRSFLLLSSLLLPTPLLAQAAPPAAGHRGGPWAADADGDGRITREEMLAWMEQRFHLMDPDGDGQVPVEAMQRMLGHERQEGESSPAQKREARGPGRGGPGSDHRGSGEHGGPGGPPPGDRPSGNRGGEAPPPGPPGAAMPYPEDSNDDGRIDLQEFVAPAMAMFDQLDANGDGVLTADELPSPPPRRGEEPDE